MAYFKESDLLFIHIPKNAGKSIEVSLGLCASDELTSKGFRGLPNRIATYLQRITSDKSVTSELYGTLDVTLCAQHLTLQEILILDLISNKELEKVKKFAVCRNPWARALSTYHHFSSSQSRSKLSFESFCENWYLMPSDSHNILAHRRRQIEFIRDCNGDVYIDKILRFENLDEEYSELCSTWKISCAELTHIGGQASSKDYAQYYSRKAKYYIDKYFEEDICYFGYKY